MNKTSLKQTPLSKLQTERQRLRLLCRIQEQKLNEEVLYMRENAGRLLFSGISALFLTSGSSKSEKKKAAALSPVPSVASLSSLRPADFLSLGTGLIPYAWELAQPLLIAWGIRRAKKWIGNLFSSKRK